MLIIASTTDVQTVVMNTSHILVKAFTTYVRPMLEYCTPVWSPHNIGLIKKLQCSKKIYKETTLLYKY